MGSGVDEQVIEALFTEVLVQRLANAFALGDRTGVRMAVMPIEANPCLSGWVEAVAVADSLCARRRGRCAQRLLCVRSVGSEDPGQLFTV